MHVEFDEHSENALDWLERTIGRGVPVRVALKRAEKRFGMDRMYLRALRSLRGEPNV